MTLVEFLLARIADDEADNATERIPIPPDRDPATGEWMTVPGQPRVGSSRVLAECEAKRRIVERCQRAYADQGIYGEDSQEELAGHILRLLALPYADHESFKPEWRV
jgi:hypothetical protein